MSWQPEMTRILRHIIDDIDGDLYSDARLEELLLVSSQLMLTQVEFENTYTIDVERATLTPDPTELTTKDNDFINLVVVKAAVVILRSELKTHAAQAYRIVDGPSTIDVSQVFKSKSELYDKMKEDLDLAILQYQIGNGSGGQVILGPYTTSLAV